MESAETTVIEERQKEPSRQLHETHPAHHAHPAHPDNHKHRAHHPHAPLIRGILAVFFFIVIALMLFSGFLTDAPFGNVILAYSPSLLLALVGAALLKSDHFDLHYLGLAFAVLILVAASVLAWLVQGVDLVFVVGMNVFLGALLLLVISHSEREEDSVQDVVVEIEGEQQDLSAVFDEIEKQAKLINVAIGRVYDVRNGGSAALRNKVKIESSDYNELSMDKTPEALRELLLGILLKVETLVKQEKDVLSSSELTKLRIEHRNQYGNSRVINVVADNEGENILEAYGILEEYTQLALNRLED